MNYALGLALLALAAHMLDAFRHYVREDETFSAALNLALGATTALMGLAVLTA